MIMTVAPDPYKTDQAELRLVKAVQAYYNLVRSRSAVTSVAREAMNEFDSK